MKVTVKKKEDSIEYPCIMESTTTGLIVLFTGESTGITLNSENVKGIGEWSKCWEDANFKLFDGQIILSN